MELNLRLCDWTVVKHPYYEERKPRQADADMPVTDVPGFWAWEEGPWGEAVNSDEANR